MARYREYLKAKKAQSRFPGFGETRSSRSVASDEARHKAIKRQQSRLAFRGRKAKKAIQMRLF